MPELTFEAHQTMEAESRNTRIASLASRLPAERDHRGLRFNLYIPPRRLLDLNGEGKAILVARVQAAEWVKATK